MVQGYVAGIFLEATVETNCIRFHKQYLSVESRVRVHFDNKLWANKTAVQIYGLEMNTLFFLAFYIFWHFKSIFPVVPVGGIAWRLKF